MSYESTINTGLPAIANPPDPAFFAEFTRVYNAIQVLATTIDAYTGALPADISEYDATPVSSTVLIQNMQRVYVLFSQTVSYGQLVNFHNVGGVLNAQLSSASGSLPAHAWCSTAGGVTAGNWGEVMIGGLILAWGSLTPGATYYLGNTAGTFSTTPGTLSQKLGYALGSNLFFFRPDNI